MAQADSQITTFTPAARKTTQAAFNRLMLDAYSLLEQAKKIPGIDDLQCAQARAAAGVAGISLHHVYGMADETDAEAFIDDLEAICRLIDPLIEAIGDEVHSEFGISASDRKLFSTQLTDALEGNAIYVVRSAGEEVTASRDDDEADHRYELRRDELRRA